MNDLDQTVTLGGAVLRLTSTADHRFRLRVDGVAGPDWSASFGEQATLESSTADAAGIEFVYRPYPGVGIGRHGELAVTVRVGLGTAAGRARDRHIALRLSAPVDYPLGDFAGPTITPSPDGSRRSDWRYLVPDGDGLWMRADGTGFGSRDRLILHDHRISLPMTAMVDAGGAGVMVVAVGGNDHAIDYIAGVDESQLSGMRLVNFSSLGTWHHDREWTVTVVPTGGAIALAEELGLHLREQGLELMTQSEKMRRRGVPAELQRSVGGTLLWCHFDTLTSTLVRDVVDSGIESIMFMGRPADQAAADAVAVSGFAGGPYFQTYDVFPPGSVDELGWRGVYPPEGATTGWPADLIHNMAGWLNSGWRYLPFAEGDDFWQTEEYLDAAGALGTRSRAVHNYTTVQTYRRCPSRHRHVVEEQGIPMLESLGASAVFYDIATAMYGLECYSPDHPVHRIEDIEYRKDILELLAAPGRLVHSEAGKWWAIDHVNTFEGLFSYDWEFNIGSIQLEDYPVNPTRRAFEFDLEHRVPFFGMVARHAVARTMWWGTGQDRHAETWASNDAITALFGANPIYVVDPDHPLAPGSARWDRFVDSSLAFDALGEIARDERVAGYETAGADVAITTFEGGSSVEANVGTTRTDGLDPGEFLVRDGSGNTVARVNPAAQVHPSAG